MKFKAKEIFLIPNILTYIRLLCVPIFIWLMLDTSISEYHVFIALAVFVFATITDVLDGKIARKFNMVSDIGRVTDPLADKLLQISALITLAVLGQVHYVFVIILLLKEAYMVLGGLVILKGFKSTFTIEATAVGKIGTLVNSLGIFLAFFHIEKFKNLYYIDWAILGVGCVIALIGAFQYSKSFFDFYKRERDGKNVVNEKVASVDDDIDGNNEVKVNGEVKSNNSVKVDDNARGNNELKSNNEVKGEDGELNDDIK